MYIFDHVSLSSSIVKNVLHEIVEKIKKNTFCVHWFLFR